MRRLKKLPVCGGLLLAACSPMALSGNGALAAPASFEGKPVRIGHGSGRVVVRADAAGKPASVAVKLTAAALQGLPGKPNKATSDGQWEYALPMPAKGPRPGYHYVVVDWNPQGHPPPKIYTVPHFDFHFYTVSGGDVAKIAFKGPSDPAAAVSDARLVPAGYQVVPDTVVDKMGVHAINMGAPEFHGKPFTATFIYGYYQGRLTFVEPMVTRDFLLRKPKFSAPVATPAQYSATAYYPSGYAVRYDDREKAYLVELTGLRLGGEAAHNQ